MTTNANGQLIKISVGSKQGPTVSDLILITKEFNKTVDASLGEIIPFEYELEVGSPGIDRELRTYRDFFWNEEKTLKVLVKGEEKNVNVEGKLIKAFEDKIIVLVNEIEKEIFIKDIIKAKIKIKF